MFSKSNRKQLPYWYFRQIIDLEEKYNAKSSFFILSLDKIDLDFNFKVEEIAEELKDIIKKGWEVALHGGHNAYNNLEEIKKQKKRLEDVIEKDIIGYRNHFLRFKVPITWKFLTKAGFKYDSTFGFADCVGFRNGMCHPFKPYNLNENKVIDILELPLVIMDSTLIDYMKLDNFNAWELIKNLIDTVEKYNGVLTVLWHNTYMVYDKLVLYKKILDYCNKKNAWMTSGEDIWSWWNSNKFV